MFSLWNVIFKWCFQLCIFLFEYVFSCLSAKPLWRMCGHLGSGKLSGLFSLKICSPPSLNQLSSHGGGFLPHPPRLVDICRLQILLAWCCMPQQQQPWLFCAAASVASWRCLPWGIISRVEAIFFPRNRKRRRGWEMGGLNNLELDYTVGSMTSAPFSLPTHLLSHGISV